MNTGLIPSSQWSWVLEIPDEWDAVSALKMLTDCGIHWLRDKSVELKVIYKILHSCVISLTDTTVLILPPRLSGEGYRENAKLHLHVSLGLLPKESLYRNSVICD